MGSDTNKRDGSAGSLGSVVIAALIVISMSIAGVAFTGTVAAQDDASVGFDLDEETAREARIGDPIDPWTIRMAGTDTVSLVLSGKDYENLSYWANVTIRDTDGDGSISVGLNTFRIGHSNPWMVESGEVVTWDGENLSEGELIPKTLGSSAESYTVGLAAGDDPSAAVTSPAQEAQLHVDDAETQGFDPATAPQASEFETLDQIYQTPDVFADLRDDLSREGDQIVADGDVQMYNPWGMGYFGMFIVAMEKTAGGDAETHRERAFKWLIDNGFMAFTLEQNVFGDNEPKILNISEAIKKDAIEIDANQSYGHVMISVRTDAEVFQVGGEGEFVEQEAGESYRARFAKLKRVDPDVKSGSTRTWADRNFSVIRPETTIKSPVNTLQNDKIGGRTNLAAGTEFNVYVQIGTDQDTLEEYQTKVKQLPFDGHLETNPQAGIETTAWNFTVDLGDVDSSEVRVAVARDNNLLASFPRGWVPQTDDPVMTSTPAPTTSDPGDGDDDTTTTSDDDAETTTSPDATTTDPGSDGGDGGDGGMIPGFTVSAALVALVAAALLARRRG